MTRNNLKAILFASLMVTMILPFSMMDISAAPTQNVEQKGKLFIKDKNEYKNLTKEDFAQLERTFSKLSDSETQEIRGNIDRIGDNMKSLSEALDIWIVSVGTDYENKSVNVGIERSGLTEKNIPLIEKQLRDIVGQDIDITISYADPLYLACSQTGDCDPVQGGTRISVGGETCSMGYRATYGTATGFVTAGHCNNGATGTSVGQPTMLDVLGTVTANEFFDGTWCDCAFVDNDDTTSSSVFNGQTVSGLLFPTMFDWLELEGTTSLGVQGGITDTYEHINPKFCQNCSSVEIKGVVVTNADTEGGDSGGTVIESTTGTPKFAGTIITDGGHYTPYYRITNAFPGITLG